MKEYDHALTHDKLQYEKSSFIAKQKSYEDSLLDMVYYIPPFFVHAMSSIVISQSFIILWYFSEYSLSRFGLSILSLLLLSRLAISFNSVHSESDEMPTLGYSFGDIFTFISLLKNLFLCFVVHLHLHIHKSIHVCTLHRRAKGKKMWKRWGL